MTNPISVLIVDDDSDNRENLVTLVEALGLRAEEATSGAAALQRLARPDRPGVVILDVLMPGMDGVETLRRYRAGGGTAPVVMCSALDEADTVVRAMRAGATDYITKPFTPDDLRETLERASGGPPTRKLAPAPADIEPVRTSLGSSPAMQAVDDLVSRIADADVPVLITGESGVGKDVVARAVHARSTRASKVFIKINCAALPHELLESELFGHERGSFTGAERTKQGHFELADGGTLFLDEIGEMPVPLQAKLLQVLQDGEFYRVGGQKKIKVDSRVIVATNVNLARAIERGTFREDLYYRLNVVQVAIPPLRERREDIPELVQIFAEKYGRRYGRSTEEVPPAVMERFLTYNFPGNIRELENLVRRLIVLRDSQFVLAELTERPAGMPAPRVDFTPAPLPLAPVGPPPSSQQPLMRGWSPAEASPFNSPSPLEPPTIPPPPAWRATLPGGDAIAHQAGGAAASQAVTDDYRIDLKDLGRKAAHAAEREAIIIMLGYTGGDKKETAERLGISYKAVLYKIREFGIGRPRHGRGAPTARHAQPLPDLS